jgi:uncharacterized UPF0160 family protein
MTMVTRRVTVHAFAVRIFVDVKVATHDGSFHADEVFAIAVLRLLGDPVEVVRTRDPKIISACDLRVDVGLRNDPATGDFDHHQKGGAGQRLNGVLYASFGLVWREYGARLCNGDSATAAGIDTKFAQLVDANDNGQTIFRALTENVAPMGVDHVIAMHNPVWDSNPTAADYERGFARAIILAEDILSRQITMALGRSRAVQTVKAAIASSLDPRIIILDQAMPWRETVIAEAPEAVFVAYRAHDGWNLQAVPERLGVFKNRRDLPKAWAGRSGADLVQVTGVDGAVFCHTRQFFAAAESRQAVLALAERALATE